MVILRSDRLYRLVSAFATLVLMLVPHAWAQCDDIVYPGNTQYPDDYHAIQYSLDHHPGALICLNNLDSQGHSRAFRLQQPVNPYTGQTLLGMGTYPSVAILDGSAQIDNTTSGDHFVQDQNTRNWVITFNDSGQTNFFAAIPVAIPSVPCQTGDQNCQYPDSVFVIDGSGNIVMPRRVLNGTPNAPLANATYAVVYRSASSPPVPAELFLSPDLLSGCTQGPPYHCDQTVDVAVAGGIIANSNNADSVTVKNLIIQKAGNPAEVGAIEAPGRNRGSNTGSNNWLIQGNEVRYNHGAGIIVDQSTIGGRTRAANCDTWNNTNCCNPSTGICSFSLMTLNDTNYIHHNGQIGLEGSCQGLGGTPPFYQDVTTCVPWDYVPGSNQSVGDVVMNNVIANNNWLRFDAGFAAGGAKFAGMWYLDFESNLVSNNQGPGVWEDINCYDGTISNNDVETNVLPKTAAGTPNGLGGGIVIEVSHKTQIQKNTLKNNDTHYCEDSTTTDCGIDGFNMGGIIIAESSDVTVGESVIGDHNGNEVTGYNGIGMAMNSSAFIPPGCTNNCTGIGRTDWCGGGQTTLTSYPDGAPYCPSMNSQNQVIHDIRDREGSDCTGYSSSGTLHNCNRVQGNTVTECTTNSDTKRTMAGLDEDMGTNMPDYTYYFLADDLVGGHSVYDNNTYLVPDPSVTTYFAPPCGQSQTCAFLSFAAPEPAWQQTIMYGGLNYGGQDLTSTISQAQEMCTDH